MITTTIFVVIAYLSGSLSSAIIICKLMHLSDPRTQGSGNPGTSNVLRFAGKRVALLVLLGDVLKGLIPVIVARIFQLHGFGLALVALAATIGHIYPLFFKFKGGKGVATSFGTLIALSPLVGAALVLTWLVVAIIFRYSSLAALIAAITTPIYIVIFSKTAYLIPILAIVLLIFWRHRGNIQRLRMGQERKLTLKKTI